MQCAAVCCSVLQRVAVCSSLLQQGVSSAFSQSLTEAIQVKYRKDLNLHEFKFVPA